ncbi:hypothetical protein ACFYSJ_36310 [Streptomyces sp. NPDC005248]
MTEVIFVAEEDRMRRVLTGGARGTGVGDHGQVPAASLPPDYHDLV